MTHRVRKKKPWKSRLRRGIGKFQTSRGQEIADILTWVGTLRRMESYVEEVVPTKARPKVDGQATVAEHRTPEDLVSGGGKLLDSLLTRSPQNSSFLSPIGCSVCSSNAAVSWVTPRSFDSQVS